MYQIKLSKQSKSDVSAGRKVILDYYRYIELPQKGRRQLVDFNRALKLLFERLSLNPKLAQIYIFKPPVETQHDYRAVVVSWFTVFWWIDEDAQICHVYRILNSKSDFTKAGDW
jgi:hypothetical protein